MHDNNHHLDGPDFLRAVAEAELANGNPLNHDAFQQRARDWRQDKADLEQLQARNASLQQALDRARNGLREVA